MFVSDAGRSKWKPFLADLWCGPGPNVITKVRTFDTLFTATNSLGGTLNPLRS